MKTNSSMLDNFKSTVNGKVVVNIDALKDFLISEVLKSISNYSVTYRDEIEDITRKVLFYVEDNKSNKVAKFVLYSFDKNDTGICLYIYNEVYPSFTSVNSKDDAMNALTKLDMIISIYILSLIENEVNPIPTIIDLYTKMTDFECGTGWPF